MSDRTFTIRAEFTFRVDDADTARNRLALYTAGMPGLIGTRMVDVTEGSERTWDDDREGVPYEPDPDAPLTERDLLNGYGLAVNADEIARRRVPHPWPEDER